MNLFGSAFNFIGLQLLQFYVPRWVAAYFGFSDDFKKRLEAIISFIGWNFQLNHYQISINMFLYLQKLYSSRRLKDYYFPQKPDKLVQVKNSMNNKQSI